MNPQDIPPLTRRKFIKTASLTALAGSIPTLLTRAAPASTYRNLVPPNRPVRVAAIAAGGRGGSNVRGCAAAGAEIVALCDVDYARASTIFQSFPKAARYRDFRQMFIEMADQIDAVTISTPDHMHFTPAMMAIEHGKHVYVEKPLVHTIGEVRALKAAAARAGVVTQMGNQGHANDGTRQLKEWIEAGVIGQVREVHTWTNRPIWPQGVPVPEPDPAGPPPTMDWNLWLGVAPVRGYNFNIYNRYAWRAWWDYGCGALGDMGCHLMDGPFWALNLTGPVKVSAVHEANSEVCAPKASVVTYAFPARGKLAPLKYVWYDGDKTPPLPPELGRDAQLPPGGSLYYGDEGVIFTEGDYGSNFRLVPEARMRAFRDRPPARIPRVPGANQYLEWLTGCQGGPAPGSNIVDYSADLTEFVLLGNLAIRLGGTIDWDPATCSCVGRPEAERLIHKQYRTY
jgi:predicted dehydrogenase